jgi:hypothetical protein
MRMIRVVRFAARGLIIEDMSRISVVILRTMGYPDTSTYRSWGAFPSRKSSTPWPHHGPLLGVFLMAEGVVVPISSSFFSMLREKRWHGSQYLAKASTDVKINREEMGVRKRAPERFGVVLRNR